MKKILLSALLLAALHSQAQNKNTLLDQDFWKATPSISTVKDAISKGASPSEMNPMAFDAVVLAIMNDAPIETIKYLTEQKGNSVEKLTHDGRTYLFWAAMKGNVPAMQYFIQKGANVNTEDSHAMTALSFAAAGGVKNTDVYETLIKAGADIKKKYQKGASLLLVSVGNDSPDLTLSNYLVSKGFSLKDKDADGNTAFDYAARVGNIDLLKKLKEKGVFPTANAMIFASQGTRRSASTLDVYQYITSVGIPASAVNKSGENALDALVRKPKQEEIISWFIQNGANPNQVDNSGNTPFYYASSSRDTSVLAMLLPKLKNINLANKEGETPLMNAVQNGNTQVVNYLLEHGANPEAKDAKGNNLAYYLIQSYRGKNAGRGMGRGGDNGKDFKEKLALLQSKGVQLNALQNGSNTLYHLAIAKNEVDLLKEISNLNIDLNAKNSDGLTALQRAAMISKNDQVLKYLIEAGAQKDVKTDMDETAYDLAKENEYLTKNNISIDFLK
ncbi:ankyrin repeat domain-containing protein [Rhizosphaericola mali]|uniref:Ankyrin repeat domain-containing protein n=1 Tax=Rhizosphaericola mali TaxID=2545455 RepID=A0A5P2G3A3_9BACT|nr:ankyrin repeat domain-containing protein [Rhizosphaericola mali]QES90304.1 ankyrin repeat domain-containing protein [Rhizosphaericola mali]